MHRTDIFSAKALRVGNHGWSNHSHIGGFLCNLFSNPMINGMAIFLMIFLPKKKTFSHSTCGHFSRKPLLGWSAGRFNYGSWSCACWFSSQLISPTQKWGPSACWVQRFVLAGFDASPSPLDDLKASVHWFSSLGNRTNSTQNRIDFIYGNFGAHIFQFDPSLLIWLFFF